MTTDQKQANACQEMKGLVIGMDPGGEAGDNTAVVLRIGSERHILRQPFAGAFIEFAQKAESTQPDKATETHQPDDRPQRERWNLVRSENGQELLVCENDHEKGDKCRWARWVPERAASHQPDRAEVVELLKAAEHDRAFSHGFTAGWNAALSSE